MIEIRLLHALMIDELVKKVGYSTRHACCRLCLQREQEFAAKSGNGHISRVKTYVNSSTTTLRDHLSVEHHVQNPDGQSKTTQLKLNFKQKCEQFEPAKTSYELNRDLTVWACLDLEPFMFTHEPGMRYFFEKNFPGIALPSRDTISRGGLYDVYDAVVGKVKDALADVRGGAIGIMFDGWTDRHKRYPYIGIRISYVDRQWKYHVTTISLKVLERHSGERISSHVRAELKAFGVDLQAYMVFTTHDGAANMVKASHLLRSTHVQHCVAHALHLLLVTDGMNKVPELVLLLSRCKSMVKKLDAKCYAVENEQTSSKDRQVMDKLVQRFSEVSGVLEADHLISMGIPDADDIELELSVESEPSYDHRYHASLQRSCETRWNSILTMIDSILSLWDEANQVLRSIGESEYCLTEDERVLLRELGNFLRPFSDLTDLVSTEQPHLGLIPLIVTEVKDATQLVPGESACVAELKQLVESRLAHRIKVTPAVQLATLLDPSTKHLITADLSTAEMKKLLIEHTKQVITRTEAARNYVSSSVPGCSSADGAQASSAIEPEACQTLPSKKMRLLQKASQSGATVSVVDKSLKIENEVNTYLLSDFSSDLEENPLNFWKKHEVSYPNLSVLAKCYLTISASIVFQSSRCFRRLH